MWNWNSSSSEDNAAIREKYEAFVQQHGDLFEDKVEPLNEEDIQVLSKKKRVLTTAWYIAIAVVVTICIVYIIAAAVTKVSDAFYMALFVGMVSLAGWMFLRQLANALKDNKKRVVRGVITAKKMVDKNRKDRGGCYFEISSRDKFQVWPEDYKKAELGDIVRIEMVTDDMFIRRVVVKVGKM